MSQYLSYIIVYFLLAFFLAFGLFPVYIYLLKRLGLGQRIREEAVDGKKAEIFKKLHTHKKGVPSLGGWMFLFVTAILVLLSLLLVKAGVINNSLISRQETYILLFAFFFMGLLWLVDDIFNYFGKSRVKGLTAKAKLVWMIIFAFFISWWFYAKLGISTVNLWPFLPEVNLGFGYFLLTFLFTLALVNAVNITDGLDWLAWGISLFVLLVLGIYSFWVGWYLSTTLLMVVAAVLLAFLWFNIPPAKIFMWDSGALALGGLMAATIYLLDNRVPIFVPSLFLLGIFWAELLTSFLQISWKKLFKKKLFPIAPLHHWLEFLGYPEYNIVGRMWLIQIVLSLVALLFLFFWLG